MLESCADDLVESKKDVECLRIKSGHREVSHGGMDPYLVMIVGEICFIEMTRQEI